jgi:hypothetical protein
MHLLSQIIYSRKMPYMFGTGLSVHHQELKTAYTATVYVEKLLLSAAIGDEMEFHGVSSYPQ